MINKEKLEKYGISLNEYLNYGLISANAFFVPKSILNLNEAFNDGIRGKELLFKSLALTVFQTINNLLAGLPEKFECENFEEFKKIVGETNAENLRRAVFEEIKFRTFNNQWPEFTNRSYLSNGLQRLGDPFNFGGNKTNLLSTAALTYLQNSNWDDLSEPIDIDYIKNLLKEYVKNSDFQLLKENFQTEKEANNSEFKKIYNEFQKYKSEIISKIELVNEKPEIDKLAKEFNDYKFSVSNRIIQSSQEVRQELQAKITESVEDLQNKLLKNSEEATNLKLKLQRFNEDFEAYKRDFLKHLEGVNEKPEIQLLTKNFNDFKETINNKIDLDNNQTRKELNLSIENLKNELKSGLESVNERADVNKILRDLNNLKESINEKANTQEIQQKIDELNNTLRTEYVSSSSMPIWIERATGAVKLELLERIPSWDDIDSNIQHEIEKFKKNEEEANASGILKLKNNFEQLQLKLQELQNLNDTYSWKFLARSNLSNLVEKPEFNRITSGLSDEIETIKAHTSDVAIESTIKNLLKKSPMSSGDNSKYNKAFAQTLFLFFMSGEKYSNYDFVKFNFIENVDNVEHSKYLPGQILTKSQHSLDTNYDILLLGSRQGDNRETDESNNVYESGPAFIEWMYIKLW